MGCLCKTTCSVLSISTKTNQVRTKCIKTKELQRFYSKIYIVNKNIIANLIYIYTLDWGRGGCWFWQQSTICLYGWPLNEDAESCWGLQCFLLWQEWLLRLQPAQWPLRLPPPGSRRRRFWQPPRLQPQADAGHRCWARPRQWCASVASAYGLLFFWLAGMEIQKWNFWIHRAMVFCYQNWSDLLWERIALVTKKNFEITTTIYSNGERTIFGNKMLF